MGFQGIGFSPIFALLKPTFSLLLRPHLLAADASTYRRTLPYHSYKYKSTASVRHLVPFIFGAGALDQ